MNLELRSIIGKGDFSIERLTFRAKADLDVGDFVVLQTGFYEGVVTIQAYETFWFPYQPISKGDLVVLYTKGGNPSSRPLKESGIAHFFYWDLKASIWEDETRAAVLLNAPEWDSKPARTLWQTIVKPARKIDT